MEQIITHENFIEAKENKIAFEHKVQEMFKAGIPKAHIAKQFSAMLHREVTVYEITKVVQGKTEDLVEELFYLKKYKRIASDIYWAKILKDIPVASSAITYEIEEWLAEELFKCFKKKRYEDVPAGRIHPRVESTKKKQIPWIARRGIPYCKKCEVRIDNKENNGTYCTNCLDRYPSLKSEEVIIQSNDERSAVPQGV